MTTLDYLLEILEGSLKRYGDVPITTKQWINIIHMAQQQMEEDGRLDLLGMDHDD